MKSPARTSLQRSVKYFAVASGFFIVYILLDFAIDIRPPAIHTSYQFNIAELRADDPRFLRQDNLVIVVIRRSSATVHSLAESRDKLQDPDSSESHQPANTRNLLRSIHPEYFVSYAMGTDLGCPLVAEMTELRETCSSARYDFAGRAFKGNNQFQNLVIPDYNFTNNFKTLTIKP